MSAKPQPERLLYRAGEPTRRTTAPPPGTGDDAPQVQERVEQGKQQLRELGARARAVVSDPQQAKQLAGTVTRRARGNPRLAAGAGAVALVALLVVRRLRG
jgi:hypothetical protein